jgi:hypothetical protein
MNIDIDTIKADITNCQVQIRNLQHSTVECISFSPAGKITVIDKDKLEGLNADIEQLGGLIGHNEAVLSRLQDVLSKVNMASIEDLNHAKNKTAGRIEDHKMRINRVIATWLKVSPNYDVVTIREHPRVKPEIATYEPLIPKEEARLKLLSAALDASLAITKEFTPSGATSTKSLKGALVRFDMQPKPKGAAF